MLLKNNAVRKARARLGLTQEQFAHRVGVSFVTVNRWENGRSNPSPLARRIIQKIVSKRPKNNR